MHPPGGPEVNLKKEPPRGRTHRLGSQAACACDPRPPLHPWSRVPPTPTHGNTQGCSGSPGAGERLRAARQKGPGEDSGRIPETRSAREVEEAEREKLFSRAESRIHMQQTKDQDPPPWDLGRGSQAAAQGQSSVSAARTLPAGGWSPGERAGGRPCAPAGPPGCCRDPGRERRRFPSLGWFLPVHSPQQNQMWTVRRFLSAFLRAGPLGTLSTPKR